jgi:SAM-dependent methyltransferase
VFSLGRTLFGRRGSVNERTFLFRVRAFARHRIADLSIVAVTSRKPIMVADSGLEFFMSMEDTRIDDLYERHADTWAQARMRETKLYEKAWLERFCALIPEPGSVLDCGCGVGTPIARYLSERGYAVTGIDTSVAMIRLFQERLPKERALVADMRTLCLTEVFHGILAWDSFFHLNQTDQRQMFSTFRAHAAPRAALMFTSGPSHGEAIGCLGGDLLYHASLDADEYRSLLQDEGFAVVATTAEDQNCGGRTVWLAQMS